MFSLQVSQTRTRRTHETLDNICLSQKVLHMLTRPLLGLRKAFPNVFSVSHVVPVDGRPIGKWSGRVTIWKRNVWESDLHLAEDVWWSLFCFFEKSAPFAHIFFSACGPNKVESLRPECILQVNRSFWRKSMLLQAIDTIFCPCVGQDCTCTFNISHAQSPDNSHLLNFQSLTVHSLIITGNFVFLETFS